MQRMNNLRAIDLNLLVVLDALLAERHLSRAAERLNMSQPAVSHALARLRILLDDPLFHRRRREMEPTLRALELSTPLAEALSQIRTVLAPEGFDPTERHVFRLAMSDYGTALLLPDLMQRLRAEAPSIDLVVTQKSREGMIGAVVDGEIDMAFGVFPDLPSRCVAETLFEDEYACLLDPLAQPQPYHGLTEARYRAAPHILTAVHGEAATELDLHLRSHHKHRHVALVLPHWNVAPHVVRGTDLILTVARRCLDTVGPDLMIAAPPIALPAIPFAAISARRRRTDPALRWLIGQVRQVSGARPEPRSE
ncbi:LysR substrate-binding domain-containing protein [Salipiger bermudensis]|uniref:LysR substrate-binding domain-containing protein n=1 Tax=Salipiger bermudensis TaxID=344736 RepID=UPI001CD4EB69|nr:LysR substrate-binding domain-containing protein [Salipiger bermudensis]MCA0964787.1 LysR family transcriptional regulator [Salipiger bermudensis]